MDLIVLRHTQNTELTRTVHPSALDRYLAGHWVVDGQATPTTEPAAPDETPDEATTPEASEAPAPRRRFSTKSTKSAPTAPNPKPEETS